MSDENYPKKRPPPAKRRTNNENKIYQQPVKINNFENWQNKQNKDNELYLQKENNKQNVRPNSRQNILIKNNNKNCIRQRASSTRNKPDNKLNVKDHNIINTENKKLHTRGLLNIASNCYMNATLQCFCHIEKLIKFFNSEQTKILAKDYKITGHDKFFIVFKEIFDNLWNSNDNSPFSPEKFKKKLGEMNPIFKGATPNDAKDLLTLILLTLHEELNAPIDNNINIIQNVTPEMQCNKQLMFENFKNDYIKNNSIIFKLFYGIICSQLFCTICKNISYSFQSFNFIIFPLEKIRNMKLSNEINCIDIVTLDDCFKYQQFPSELMEGYCNHCQKDTYIQICENYYILPNIIVIILNRGKGLQYDINFSVSENLNLGQYVENLKNESFYELIGLVTHYGTSSASGHFIARCKSPYDHSWYKYNDQFVEKLGFFSDVEFNTGHPYILFYQKIELSIE